MAKSRMVGSGILGLTILLASLATPHLGAQTAQSSPAQTSAPPASTATQPENARLAKLEQQAADAKGSADNAWMLASAALVLMMTGPGLALFYGGLVRKKNVLGTMMQSF